MNFKDLSRWEITDTKKEASMQEIEFPEITEEVKDILARNTCLCGKNFKGKTVVGYPHDGGWDTAKGRYWLYVTCNCGYQMALWKIGVPRTRSFA